MRKFKLKSLEEVLKLPDIQVVDNGVQVTLPSGETWTDYLTHWDTSGNSLYDTLIEVEIPNDVISFLSVGDWSTIVRLNVEGNHISASHYHPLCFLTEVTEHEDCVCDIKWLVSYGCRCGGFARVMAKKATRG